MPKKSHKINKNVLINNKNNSTNTNYILSEHSISLTNISCLTKIRKA